MKKKKTFHLICGCLLGIALSAMALDIFDTKVLALGCGVKSAPIVSANYV